MPTYQKFTLLAATEGLDPRTLERVAATDPDFPAIIQQSPRVKVVDADAWRRYLVIREQRSARAIRLPEVQA